MKTLKIYLLTALMCGSVIGTKGQWVSSLNQNFNVDCSVSGNFPSGWLHYNPVAGTEPAGVWSCDPANGRKTITGTPTPGMTCTGVWGGAYNVDTSYLISPRLWLYGQPHVYLYFDTKADSLTLGGKLSIMYTTDTLTVPTFVYTDTTSGIIPAFGAADSLGWVTHELDISRLAGTAAVPFYLAFRYVSSTTWGSM